MSLQKIQPTAAKQQIDIYEQRNSTAASITNQFKLSTNKQDDNPFLVQSTICLKQSIINKHQQNIDCQFAQCNNIAT
jgi:hypothetical protein